MQSNTMKCDDLMRMITSTTKARDDIPPNVLISVLQELIRKVDDLEKVVTILTKESLNAIRKTDDISDGTNKTEQG